MRVDEVLFPRRKNLRGVDSGLFSEPRRVLPFQVYAIELQVIRPLPVARGQVVDPACFLVNRIDTFDRCFAGSQPVEQVAVRVVKKKIAPAVTLRAPYKPRSIREGIEDVLWVEGERFNKGLLGFRE